MKTKTCCVGVICICAVVSCTFVRAQTTPHASSSPAASPRTATSPAASLAKQGTRPIPFHGMISAVDQNAKTFAISGKKQSRIFKVTDKTSITKAGKTATMQDVTENEEASGSYWKNPDGTLEAKIVKLGPQGQGKTSPSPTASPKLPAEPKP